ncbi:MAG TPA: ABC transporter permease [Burkholderiaceae bacterium]|nr:ABC transporter permease [Burkholderiaceae bacterium]
MYGQILLAFKLLVNDRAKFAALLIGITFAVFLMVQMTSMFAGVLNRSSSTVINVGSKMWVMDPAVNTAANSIPMPDYILDVVRSIDGVRYAVPLFSGGALVKLASGAYQAVSILGLDDSSLFGRPQLLEGRIEDIYAESGFIVVKDAEFSKLNNPTIGTEFEINDNRAVVVGIAQVSVSGLFGVPTLYTTYNRAIQYLPTTRFTAAYVLVEPKSAADVAHIKSEVAQLGYVALTEDEFIAKIVRFYTYQTGLGINILLMTVISFIVGLSISGQTFYTFILENLEKFGALKAIGAKSRELVAMILFQATFTALTGYGLGLGLCVAVLTVTRLRVPDYAATVNLAILAIALAMVVVIAAISSYIGVRKVLRIEPFDIFRG